jgi:SAM-dependent methyltransferase
MGSALAAEDSGPVSAGYLDHVDGNVGRGWAVTKGGSSPLLVLRVDGRNVSTFRPNLSRPDLQNIYPGNALGFEIPVSVQPHSEVAVLDAFGNHLTGSPARPQLSREQKVTTRINKSMRVLEIGGGYSPLITKADGWNSFSLDHATRDQLVAKYAAHGRDTSRIEHVDFLWTGGPLESAIPPEQLGSFDACVASHLIEHIPDPISFYNSLARILDPNGVISLVVPDKRFIFDFFRPISTTSQLIESPGACMLISKDCRAATGDFDEKTFPIAYNDIDYCLRAGEHGFRTVWTPFATLLHHESASRGSDESPANHPRFLREQEALRAKYGLEFYVDRAFNPWYGRDSSKPVPESLEQLPEPR